MREIKFRVWDDVQKKMFYDVGLLGWELYVNIDGKGYDMVGDCGDFKLLQFTGLYDKNGKEIYEGDIVKLVSTEWADDDPIIDVVEWGLGDRSYPAFDLKKFSYETEMNSFSYIFNSGYYEIEVIGNIYEDKHLLDGDK